MPKSLFLRPEDARAPGNLSFSDIPLNAYSKTIAQEKDRFTDEDLLTLYRDMCILREFESMLNLVKTQGNYNGVETSYPGPAHLSLGQESAAVGEAWLLGKEDIIFGSHRSHGEFLAKSLSCIHKMSEKELTDTMESFFDGRILRAVEGMGAASDVREQAIRFTLYGALAEIFARANGFNQGMGGSMHVFFLPFGVYPNNAIVGGSGCISAGAALYKKCNGQPGIVVCNMGDGSLGCGPVWEALNFASMSQYHTLWENEKKGGLPLVFNFFNNGYGMGGQTGGETMGYEILARVGAGISPSQLHAERVDGLNPLAVIDAYRRKLDLLKKGKGPVLLDVVTYRHCGHSTSDQNAYRTKEEIDAWEAEDPLERFPETLLSAGIATRGRLDAIRAETRERMTAICRLASDENLSPLLDFAGDRAVLERLMFSNGDVPSMGTGTPVTLAPKETCSRVKQVANKERAAVVDGKAVSRMKLFNIRDAIFEPLIDKFYEDSSLIAYGEDVRDWGGAFAVYRGLSEVLPHSRLFNAPISEAAIVGSAVGYALSGGRCVVELMYADFIGRAGDEIFNQLSKWQAMSAGILKMPVVLRISVGAKYGAQHSQDWVALCAHIPGLKVCFPATPWEAKGLMTSALNGTDPVVFFESQRIYDMGEMFHEGGVPRERYTIPIGDTNLVRKGSDLTILTIGATLYKAVEAAEILREKHGLEAEIINLHSLVPLDYEKIVESVNKTGRVVLASDACARGSFLNDVARNITELCFDRLDGPPVVVGARNWITPPFEYDEQFFPQAGWILDAVHEKILPLKGHSPSTDFTDAAQLRRSKHGT